MIGAWLAKQLSGVAFWFILWGVRQAIAIHAGMPGMKYKLRMDPEGGGLFPVHSVTRRDISIGFLTMTRADARDFLHDASLGAFILELIVADDAERAERKAKVKKPNS